MTLSLGRVPAGPWTDLGRQPASRNSPELRQGEEKLEGIQKVLYPPGDRQAAPGNRASSSEQPEISGGCHPPASPPHLEMGRTPHAPILQLGPGSHPHLWFLLGSPWGPERLRAHRRLPHPLRVLSHLETTKSGNHLRGWDGPCHTPHLVLFGDAKVQEWGGRKETQPHAKKQPHRAGPRAVLPLEISPGKHEYSVQEATTYETTGPSTRKARTAHL